jgi:hypothetical protein
MTGGWKSRLISMLTYARTLIVRFEETLGLSHVAVNDLELGMVKSWSEAEIDTLRGLLRRSYGNLRENSE